MPRDRQQRYVESEQLVISNYDVKNTSWKLFNLDWTLASLKQTVLKQVSGDKAGYIGATQSPSWRHELCRDHETMRPHSDHYDKMFVLTVDVAACVEVLEELLIELCEATASSRILNDVVYHRGSLPEHGHLFLYLCVV